MFSALNFVSTSKMLSLWLVLCLSIISFNSCGVYAKNKSIHHPCSVTDLDCIRNYFANHFDCTAASGPVPDPYEGACIEVPIPHANATFVKTNSSKTTGLRGGEVKKFYINKTSEYLVLEVVFEKIAWTDPSGVIIIHKKGREPIHLTDSFYISDRSISLTLVTSYKNDLEISAKTVYSYIGNPKVSYKLGRGFFSDDPAARSSLKKAVADIQTTVLEAYHIVGPLFMSVFVESNICKLNNKDD